MRGGTNWIMRLSGSFGSGILVALESKLEATLRTRYHADNVPASEERVYFL